MQNHSLCCPGQSRRSFLSSAGMGLAGVAFQVLLARDRTARAAEDASPDWVPPDGRPHRAPRAKQVIWMMMRGGFSHLESFDPKPELTVHAGKTLAESPHKGVLESPYLKNVREQVANNIIDKTKARIFPSQIGFQKGGQSGIEVSDWFPHVRGCVDDLAVIRSMWTTDNNHAAQMEFLTGRHLLDGCFPTLGAWIQYGLAAQSDNLPQFISMGPPLDLQCFGGTDSDYLGPEHAGVILKIDPENPQVLYTNNGYGPYDNGLMKSSNGGVDWEQSWPQCSDKKNCWNTKDAPVNKLAPGFLGDPSRLQSARTARMMKAVPRWNRSGPPSRPPIRRRVPVAQLHRTEYHVCSSISSWPRRFVWRAARLATAGSPR
jgi:hypothetical protein